MNQPDDIEDIPTTAERIRLGEIALIEQRMREADQLLGWTGGHTPEPWEGETR